MNKTSEKKHLPSILLVGSGRFGLNHLRVLLELHSKKVIDFKGVVVRNEEKRKNIEKEYGVKTHSKITPSLLKEVEAVDIVTPPETHFELVKKCLPYTNVFVEKPLTTDTKEAEMLDSLAKKYKRVLAVGHIYRYHAVTEKIKTILHKKGLPTMIRGSFINPTSSDQQRDPSFELMHLFDIVHYIWEKDGKVIHSRKDARMSHVDIRYAKNSDAHYVLGWTGNEKERIISFKYPKYFMEADFEKNTVTEKKEGKIKVHNVDNKEDMIAKELKHFVEVIGTKSKTKADGMVGKKMVEIAERAMTRIKSRPTVAVIGGGIFGTSAALEIASFCDITILEKNSELMLEGTLVNCFRHHGGYHYPRSGETVLDIQNSRKDFEKVYGKAIVSSYPTYYGIARNNSHVSPKEFIKFCKKYNLPYEKSNLSTELLSKKEIALCVKVPEYGYHYETLVKIVKSRLEKEKGLKILKNSKVISLILNKDSSKTVVYTKNKKSSKKKFDFVINATYADINYLTNSADFEQFSMRVDLAEVLVIKMNIPPVSITIIDGPFATLLPTGNKNEFTLYHVTESILDRYVPKDGLTKMNSRIKSNQAAIMRESMKLFPMLKDAVVVESRIINRGVRAYREHDDSRVADIIDHGFGCWSILSGKILSSVSTGKKLSHALKKTTK